MQKYIITQDYFDTYPQLADAGFCVGDIVIINDEGYLVEAPKSKGEHTDESGDPNTPPPQTPPILP